MYWTRVRYAITSLFWHCQSLNSLDGTHDWLWPKDSFGFIRSLNYNSIIMTTLMLRITLEFPWVSSFISQILRSCPCRACVCNSYSEDCCWSLFYLIKLKALFEHRAVTARMLIRWLRIDKRFWKQRQSMRIQFKNCCFQYVSSVVLLMLLSSGIQVLTEGC